MTTLDRWDVRHYLDEGYTIQAQTDTELVLFKPVESHLLGNLFMTVLTFGLWVIPWLIGATFARPSTVVIDLTQPSADKPPSFWSEQRSDVSSYRRSADRHLAKATGNGLMARHHQKAAARLTRFADRIEAKAAQRAARAA